MTTPTPPSDLIAEMARAMEDADTHWLDYAHLAQAAYAVVRERIEGLKRVTSAAVDAIDSAFGYACALTAIMQADGRGATPEERGHGD